MTDNKNRTSIEAMEFGKLKTGEGKQNWEDKDTTVFFSKRNVFFFHNTICKNNKLTIK